MIFRAMLRLPEPYGGLLEASGGTPEATVSNLDAIVDLLENIIGQSCDTVRLLGPEMRSEEPD